MSEEGTRCFLNVRVGCLHLPSSFLLTIPCLSGGLGRVQGNFEKFLLDGRTGLPLRRYPRKYAPSDLAEDIEAVIAGRPLPPPRANWMEEWRSASTEAKTDTYRFEKGLNYFDQ